jgi:hypothetical protein
MYNTFPMLVSFRLQQYGGMSKLWNKPLASDRREMKVIRSSTLFPGPRDSFHGVKRSRLKFCHSGYSPICSATFVP